jgi:hypothetical protein
LINVGTSALRSGLRRRNYSWRVVDDLNTGRRRNFNANYNFLFPVCIDHHSWYQLIILEIFSARY